MAVAKKNKKPMNYIIQTNNNPIVYNPYKGSYFYYSTDFKYVVECKIGVGYYTALLRVSKFENKKILPESETEHNLTLQSVSDSEITSVIMSVLSMYISEEGAINMV